MDTCNVSWRNQLRTLVIDTFNLSNFITDIDDDEGDDERLNLYALTRNLSHASGLHPEGFIQNLIFNNINATWRTGDYDEGSFEIELNKFSHSH